MAVSRLFPTAKSFGKNRNRSLRVEHLEGRELVAADAGVGLINPNIDLPIPDLSDIVIPIDPWVGTWNNSNPVGGLTKLQITKGGDGGYDVRSSDPEPVEVEAEGGRGRAGEVSSTTDALVAAAV